MIPRRRSKYGKPTGTLMGALAGLLVTSPWLSAQLPRPLPEADAFVAAVRARLFTDEDLQRDYTYLEKREEVRVSKLGKVHVGRTRLFEVYPSPEPGHRYRRLIADDGVPLDPKELERRDGEYQKYLSDVQQQRLHESPTARARREAKEAADRRARDEIVDDVFRVFEMRLIGREAMNGHTAIVVSLTSRADARPRSKPGRYFPKFNGRVWVSEAEYEVMKAELDSTETINVGWGFLGRIQEGGRFTYERTKVNDEVWLPRLARFEMRGRSLLVRKFDLEATTEFSNYRKFSVTTRETFDGPTRQ